MTGTGEGGRPDAPGAQDLVDALDKSLRRLEEAGGFPSGQESSRQDGLLQDCLALCREAAAPADEPIRTLHQFACSGGTLISKCVAAMPNVQLLSEVDPLFPWPAGPKAGEKPRFTPSDMPALLRASTRGASEALIAEVFRAEVRVVHEHSVRSGLRLVLRDHAHTHYCRGAAVPDRPTTRQLVTAVAPVVSVVTVRHPVDSFASLVSNGWVHFSPPDFGTYCERYLRFLDDHAGVDIVRYEDLVESPAAAMRRICEALKLPWLEEFQSVFSVFHISGDSGRAGDAITVRPRTPQAQSLMSEANDFSAYRLLASRLGYGTLVQGER